MAVIGWRKISYRLLVETLEDLSKCGRLIIK